MYKFQKLHNGGGATLLAKNNKGFDSVGVLNYNSIMRNYSCRKHFSVILNLIQYLRNKRFRNEFGMTDSLYPTDESCHPELVSGSEFKSSKKSKKLVAFTLAEVLITLAIIGIVAAMTIPTLVSNIQERQFHAKWKECYAILNSSFKAVVANNPRLIVSNAGVNAMTVDFMDLLLENVRVVDSCGWSRTYDNKLCDNYSNWPKANVHYKWSAISASSTELRYKSLAGGNINSYDVQGKAALLSNGAALYFGSSGSGLIILVDVNNYLNGPNVLGKDVYVITFMRASNQKNVYIEELKFAPLGMPGTYGASNPQYGSYGCSSDIGEKDSLYIYKASGAGCSYKYLSEK